MIVFVFAAAAVIAVSTADPATIRARIDKAMAEHTAPIDALNCDLEDQRCLGEEMVLRHSTDQWIRGEIESREVCGDEEARANPACLDEIFSQMANLGIADSARMESVVDRYGWPLTEMWNAAVENAAFFLVQHGLVLDDNGMPSWNIALARRVLPDVKASVNAGNLSPWHYAALYDRIQIDSDKPQRFGTQFLCVDGRLQPGTLEDPKNVDARRKTLGLEPLKESLPYDGPC